MKNLVVFVVFYCVVDKILRHCTLVQMFIALVENREWKVGFNWFSSFGFALIVLFLCGLKNEK